MKLFNKLFNKIMRIECIKQSEHSIELKLTGGLLRLLDRLSSEDKKKFCDELRDALQAKLDKNSNAK